MNNTPARPEQIEKLGELIKDIQIAFVTTLAADGSLHARPMATQRDTFDGTLYFFTGLDSAKVREASRDERVSVTYADPSHNTYVALTGTARAYRDAAKVRELWHPFIKTWFPQGPDDPNLGILEVQIDHAEYWDSPSSTLIHLYGIAKATLTGKSPDPGDHQAFDVAAGRPAARV